jgi:hypothetical protein
MASQEDPTNQSSDFDTSPEHILTKNMLDKVVERHISFMGHFHQ